MDAAAMHHHKSCPFTEVSLEISLLIYHGAIETTTDKTPDSYGKYWLGKTWCYNLASTCRQLRGEFLPLILNEGMTFTKNDNKITVWARNAPPAMRPLIQHLMLSFSKEYCQIMERLPIRLEDYGETPAELKFMLQQRQEPFASSEDYPHSDSQHALDRITSIWNAVHCFPNVKRLWINATGLDDYSHNPPLSTHGPQASLLMRIISFAFPNLHCLRLGMDLPPLSCLIHFHQLRRLHFSGYSKTCLSDTLLILQSLKHLDSIKIEQFMWQPVFPLPPTLNSGSTRFRNMVMTPDIISQMNPLKDFTITSSSDFRVTMWHTVPLTRPLMDAFLVHSQSLQSLKITQTFFHPPFKKDIFEILDFVHTSPIPQVCLYLTLPWPLTKTLDPKRFLPPRSGKRMDIFLHDNVLEVRTGKYFPSARELECRR